MATRENLCFRAPRAGLFDHDVALFLFADRNDVVPGKCLRILLGVIGVGLLVATAAVFLPVEWMAAIHRWLGLGEFPDSPITIYLARSTSLLYAVHGFLMLYTAIHLHQYLSLSLIHI